MDLSNKFLQLPKSVIDSYYEDDNKVVIQGRIKEKAFERQFKSSTRSATLTPEKAVYLAMQVPAKPLKSIQDCLK